MRQEVNLLSDSLKTLSPMLSLSKLLIAVVLVSCIFIVAIFTVHRHLQGVHRDIFVLESSISDFHDVTGSAERYSNYQNVLNQTEDALLKKYQLWMEYKNITQQGETGFSELLFHIANLSDKNIYLENIDINLKERFVVLSGYAKQAKYVPIYIDKLRKEDTFSQFKFGALLIESIDSQGAMKFSISKPKKIAQKRKLSIDEIRRYLKGFDIE